MNTGTIALNAAAGSTSSSTAPVIPPEHRHRAQPQRRRALARELAPVADRAGDRPGNEADGVRDVGRDRRVAEGEQHREGDQRAAAHDGVDRARGHPRQGDADDLAEAQVVFAIALGVGGSAGMACPLGFVAWTSRRLSVPAGRTRRSGRARLRPRCCGELFELASWAPNHHLTNPWRFRVLGPRTRARLMELAESEQPGSAVKLARAPTLVAVSARARPASPPRTARTCWPRASPPTSCCSAPMPAGLAAYWRTVPLLDDPRGRALLEMPAEETPARRCCTWAIPSSRSGSPSARRLSQVVISLD